jgi:hypothetical protein
MFVARPSHMDVSQVTQNGIEFREEPAECHPIAMKVGWIDILQQRALINGTVLH